MTVVLQRGSKGELVKDWQTLLNMNGFSVKVDGDFGPATEYATKSYQRSIGVNDTGVVTSDYIGGITKLNPTKPSLPDVSTIADRIGMPELKRVDLGTGSIELNGANVATPFKALWAKDYRMKVWSKRRTPPIGIVLHETAGSSASGALQTWASVVGGDFLIDTDGTVLQCADPIKNAPWHAEGWSPAFVGIEVVGPVTEKCPYGANPGVPWGKPWNTAPRYRPGGPFDNVLEKLGKGVYVPPFPIQLDATCALVEWLRNTIPSLADCRVIDESAWRLKDIKPRPGIVCHAQVKGIKLDGYGPLAAVCTNLKNIT